MGGDAERLAQEFFASSFDEQAGDGFERLAEDVVVRPSNGQIYIGHEGYARWHQEQAGDYRDRLYAPASIDVVREHWVLMAGAAESTGEGTKPPQPGAWLVHIREGLIAAILHYETEQAAREALSERR